MPSRLHRYQQTRDLHFITFSCYRRKAKLGAPATRAVFEHALEITRQRYGLSVIGYVVMPEHMHMLLSEPERGTLSTAIKALKQSVSRTLALRGPEHFWEQRYYNFNVWTAKKHIEKLKYLHRNPVARGLAVKPEDWEWSSFRHYATGMEGVVEIESQWTARRRKEAIKGNSFPTQASLNGTPPNVRSEDNYTLSANSRADSSSFATDSFEHDSV